MWLDVIRSAPHNLSLCLDDSGAIIAPVLQAKYESTPSMTRDAQAAEASADPNCCACEAPISHKAITATGKSIPPAWSFADALTSQNFQTQSTTHAHRSGLNQNRTRELASDDNVPTGAPTTSRSPSQAPTTTPTTTGERNFVLLDAAVVDGASINITASYIPFASTIVIVSSDTVEIWSAISPTLSGGGVRRLFRVNGDLTLRSVQLTDGRSNVNSCNAPYLACSGGAIYVGGSGVLKLDSCTIYENRAYYGGAIMVNSGSARVSNSVFMSNSALSIGGAMYMIDCGANISSSTLTSNYAPNAGAMYIQDGNSDISGSAFTSNSASNSGGAVYLVSGTSSVSSSTFTSNAASDGGVMYISYCSVGISTSMFSSNFASSSSSYYSSHGGVLYVDDGSAAVISNSTFESNYASTSGLSSISYGGVLSIYGSSADITNSTFTSNFASSSYYYSNSYGGVMYIAYGSANIADSTFTSNSADVSYYSYSASGGVMHVSSGSAVVSGSVFTSNFASSSAVYYGYSTNGVSLCIHNRRVSVGSSPLIAAIHRAFCTSLTVALAFYTRRSSQILRAVFHTMLMGAHCTSIRAPA